MSGVAIGGATITTPISSDVIPFARIGEETARNMTVGDIVNYANAYDLREYGTTSSAFATACAAAIADSRPLYVPAGTYDFSAISAAVTVDGALTLVGDGIGKTILQGGATKDLFTLDGGSLSCTGIEFDTWDDVVLCTATTAHIPYLRFYRCRFDTVDYGIIWNDDDSAYDLNEIRVEGCEFVTITTSGIELYIPDIDRGWIVNNYFKDCGYRGVWFGAGNDGDTVEYAHICHNHFDTMGVSDSRTEVHAIIAFRQYLDISHNTIDTILSGAADDWEAIYCKTKYSTISHNNILNGGDTCIMLKGVGRGDGSPTGGIVEAYANIVDHNIIVGGTDGIVFGEGGDQFLIDGNYCEGMVRAIVAAAGDNHVIQNNRTRLTTGQAAIYVGPSAITDITLRGNSIDAHTYGSPTAVGILFANTSAATSGVKILNNVIRDVDASTATGFGIDFQLGQNMDFAEISGNIFEDLDYGIRFDTAQQVAVDASGNIFRSVTTPMVNWSSITTRVAKGNVGWNPGSVTFVDGDTDPSVANSADWYIFPDQTNPTTVTTFDGGSIGDKIVVYFTTNETTLDDNANLVLGASSDYTPPAETYMGFMQVTATRWVELWRKET